MNSVKLATIKDGNAVITVSFNPYIGKEYCESIVAEGDADMVKEFLLYSELKYYNVCHKHSYAEWGTARRLCRMYAEAKNATIEIHEENE